MFHNISDYIQFINDVDNNFQAPTAAAILYYRGRYSPLFYLGGQRKPNFSTADEANDYMEIIKSDLEPHGINVTFITRVHSGRHYIEYSLS